MADMQAGARGCNIQASGLLILARMGGLELDGEVRHGVLVGIWLLLGGQGERQDMSLYERQVRGRHEGGYKY